MMKKSLTLSLGLLLLSTPAFAMGSRRAPVPEAPKVEAPRPVVVDPGYIKIKLNVSGSAAQVSRITRLAGVAEKIINSEKFKSRVLGAWYKGKSQFVDSDKTPAQVYESIRRASELDTGDDYVINMSVGVERARCSTLGWTTPADPRFYFNSCTFDSREDSGVTGTLVHEWSHKLGYVHSKYNNEARPYSAPYALGTIVAELYGEFK